MNGNKGCRSYFSDELINELNRLLHKECFNYPEQAYVTPRIVAPGVFKNPESYPLLSQRKKQIVTRMISDYMKSLGRVKRGANGHCCWVDPNHVGSAV